MLYCCCFLSLFRRAVSLAAGGGPSGRRRRQGKEEKGMVAGNFATRAGSLFDVELREEVDYREARWGGGSGGRRGGDRTSRGGSV